MESTALGKIERIISDDSFVGTSKLIHEIHEHQIHQMVILLSCYNNPAFQ